MTDRRDQHRDIMVAFMEMHRADSAEDRSWWRRRWIKLVGDVEDEYELADVVQFPEPVR